MDNETLAGGRVVRVDVCSCSYPDYTCERCRAFSDKRALDQQIAEAVADPNMTPETQRAVEAVMRATYDALVDGVAGGDAVSKPAGWRRIEVEPFCKYAREAAGFLVLIGAADEVYPSFMVPDNAVWSLNGEPQLPKGFSYAK